MGLSFFTFTLFVAGSFTLITDASAQGFYVQGTTLYDANGQPFVMRGINMAHTWFKSQSTISLEAIYRTLSNTVRIVLSNGQVWQRDSLDDVKRLIQQCKDLQMIAVVEIHDATGRDDIASLNHAVDYWVENREALIGNERYVILNIANEWAGAWDSTNWRNGYVQAIPRLRAAGIRNTIMVDAAGWGQYPQSIVDYGTEVLRADQLRNTMFSIHMYEYAGGNEQMVRENIDNVLNKNLAVVIGEFGNQHTDGYVDANAIMNHSQQRGVGYLGWSWTGNNAELAYLDIAYSFNGASYTPWGNTLIYHQNGIQQTSRTASIF